MDTITVEAVRKLLAGGATDAEVGAAFGLSRSTAMRFRQKHGLAPSGPVGVRGDRRDGARPVAPPKADAPISIAEFLLNKKRAVCPVCRLKPEVAALVTKARKDGERGADIVEYLQAIHKVKVDPADFARHISQRHIP
jgi:hypothetical protein